MHSTGLDDCLFIIGPYRHKIGENINKVTKAFENKHYSCKLDLWYDSGQKKRSIIWQKSTNWNEKNKEKLQYNLFLCITWLIKRGGGVAGTR